MGVKRSTVIGRRHKILQACCIAYSCKTVAVSENKRIVQILKSHYLHISLLFYPNAVDEMLRINVKHLSILVTSSVNSFCKTEAFSA